MWAMNGDFFPKSTIWKGGEKTNLIVQNLTQMTKISNRVSIDSWYYVMNMVLFHCSLLLKTCNTNLSMRKKKLDKYQLRVIRQKHLTDTFQNCQSYQEQGKSKTLSSQQRWAGVITAKWNVVSWMGSWTKAGQQIS